MYQPNDIANWFLASIEREVGESITHLKLQKLLYYAQAWSLALHARPLFDEPIEAWAHGPVPSIFQAYKGNGWNALPPPQSTIDIAEIDSDLLSTLLDTYGQHSAKHLENLTHSEDPWKIARGNLAPEAKSSAVISHEAMRDYYKKQYMAADAA